MGETPYAVATRAGGAWENEMVMHGKGAFSTVMSAERGYESYGRL